MKKKMIEQSSFEKTLFKILNAVMILNLNCKNVIVEQILID